MDYLLSQGFRTVRFEIVHSLFPVSGGLSQEDFPGANSNLLNGKPIEFKSTKSKELLALLVAYNGSTLTMGDAIAHLWPDKDVELAKKLYRDAVWRLRKTLKDSGIGDIVEFQKAKTYIKKEGIKCDYCSFIRRG